MRLRIRKVPMHRPNALRVLHRASIVVVAIALLGCAEDTSEGGGSDALDGINGSLLEHEIGPGVVMVVSRPCDGFGVGQGTGFAIDPRTIVTNGHVVAENEEPDPVIDPHPWIQTYGRGWQRGTVIGRSTAPDIAVIRLDDGEADLPVSLSWSTDDVEDGQHLASLGYPGIENGEFNLVVGTASDVDGTNRSIESFGLDRALSGRTGPGNSGGPVVNADGEVVGVLTWGTSDRSHWFAQDSPGVREQVERFVDSPAEPNVACDSESPERYGLSYMVRLGTFSDALEMDARRAIVESAGPPGVTVTSVNSDGWTPYLLSDYPFVLVAGPFESRQSADAAVVDYEAALEAGGQSDQPFVGVLPTTVFGELDEDPSCMETTGDVVVVHGVSSADPLNLRSDPGADAEVVTTFENGQLLLVGDLEPVVVDGTTWLPVETPSDLPLCGWVARLYTQPADE